MARLLALVRKKFVEQAYLCQINYHWFYRNCILISFNKVLIKFTKAKWGNIIALIILALVGLVGEFHIIPWIIPLISFPKSYKAHLKLKIQHNSDREFQMRDTRRECDILWLPVTSFRKISHENKLSHVWTVTNIFAMDFNYVHLDQCFLIGDNFFPFLLYNWGAFGNSWRHFCC